MSGPRDDEKPPISLTTGVEEMKIEEKQEGGSPHMSSLPSPAVMANDGAQLDNDNGSAPRRLTSQSPTSRSGFSQSPAVKSEQEDTIGGDITVKKEPGKAPKLSRKMSQRVIAKPPTLYTHLPDATDDATATFEILTDCHYATRSLGNTEQALECYCSEQWDAKTRTNHACGEDSDCINRATKMECPGDCGCGAMCQNQRFQQKQYGDVSVIKTDKKGFGLRANKDLKANDFIFEYIGEVISEPAFRRRMHQYDQEGIKHFYFMSLTKSEFVDATKKGNLGRFCNHSCNPNCFVDKWVVGDKLRMGIFAERSIQAGEELVFNYNVDRYGADPQPCYCGEPNCSGFIGGKTQTDDDRSTQLSTSVQHALGIHSFDDWNDAVTTKPKRKKRASEDDEEYVDSVELKPLDVDACVPLMAELYKNPEKWIIVKCLERIQSTNDAVILNRIAVLHGYTTLNRILKQWIDDTNVVLQVIDVIHKIPTLTKNKIIDAKIEETVSKLKESDDERVRAQATELIAQWSTLEVAYRIPRVKRDPNLAAPEKRPDRPERRERERSRSRSRSTSRSKSTEVPKAPSGPRSNIPQRGSAFHSGPRPPFRPRPTNGALPPGWFEHVAANGQSYFYNASGAVTWQRPTLPSFAAPPPPPPKAISDAQTLQNLINSIVAKPKAGTRQEPSSASATPKETPAKDSKSEQWRSWPIEKQKKLYENTLFPITQQVMKDFRGKLEKDEIKRFGKEIAKKLVDSDFKNNRVSDPSRLDSKTKKKITQYMTQYFEKAVAKKKAHEKRRADKAVQQGDSSTPALSPTQGTGTPASTKLEGAVSDDEDAAARPVATPSSSRDSPGALKRRREEQDTAEGAENDSASKKVRTGTLAAPPPPPPPPPPPGGDEMEGVQTGRSGRTPSEELTNDAKSSIANNEGMGFTIKGIASKSSKVDESPTQVATPPTTGSPDGSERGKKHQDYTGVNPDRMRLIGNAGNQ